MNSERFQNEWLSLAGDFYRVAFYILEDAAEAEDAVQELFLKLWSGRDALDGIRSAKGYGIRVLRNLCLDRIRRSRKMETPAVLPEPEWPGRQDESPRCSTPSNPCPTGSAKCSRSGPWTGSPTRRSRSVPE